MSSPFQKNFSAKSPMSPLNGAYTEGRDGDIRTYRQSDRELFAKLQNDITGATLASMNPKVSKCDEGAEYYFDKDGAKFVCPKKSSVKDTGLSVEDTKKALKRIGATTTDDKNDPYNLTAEMEKNPGLTNKKSIEQRVGEDLLGKFNVGNTYQ